MTDEPFWSTPEEAAVGSFSPAAEAKVVEVRWTKPGMQAVVHITVGPDYDYFVEVVRNHDGWVDDSSWN